MEADWEFEIGEGAAVIDAAWSGFVDLRRTPERAVDLSEAEAFPALGQAFIRLNGPGSPVWTAKCDFWPELEPGTWDPDEMDAAAGEDEHASGCYIDLLPLNKEQWTTPKQVESACRAFCARLGAVPLSGCRVDWIVRRAFLTPVQTALGITAYLTACGATAEAAHGRLAECVGRWVECVWPDDDPVPR